ncbi:MAG: hypothetical protein NTW59_01190 [Candidatus Diapherotrites archaeon]|nr:hypothetical protein [Candidatus Diapherotrites archaeon]
MQTERSASTAVRFGGESMMSIWLGGVRDERQRKFDLKRHASASDHGRL